MPPASGSEEGQESGVLAALFESYALACRKAADVDFAGVDAFEEDVERVKEHLRSAAGEAAACMICLESIRPQDPVWSCQSGCFDVMHLPCVQSWSRRTLAAAQAKPAPNPMVDPAGAAAAAARGPASWGCPKCREEYTSVPSGYTCWCGKVPDPEWNAWNAAHSCGERCGKPAAGCGHPCMLLCHPGPCPPCPRVVSASCHCGAVVTDKRCGRQEFSCGGECGAVLPCGHTCPAACHDGGCPPCGLVSDVACRCGAVSRQLPCSQTGVLQCTRVCGKPLDCGRHRCEQVCHAGKCGTCSLAGPKACPCGKQHLPNAACDVVVPPCGETCGKLLSCGVHTCHDRCHAGPCTSVCRETVEKSCECGKTHRTVQCQEMFRCERRCTQMRSCGRHPCRRRCCDGVSCPPCPEICNKWLKCRNHRCPAPCHAGECAPCPLSARISCACGRTSYTVPCGREGAALPPRCTQLCPVAPLCRHAAAAAPHRCHFGPCPACDKPCGSQLDCGHGCSEQRCHDPPPPVVPEYRPPPPPVAPLGPTGSGGSSKEQREAAAALPPAQAVAAQAQQLLRTLPRTAGGHLTACPSCQQPVPVTCRGGHLTVQMPCSTAGPFACEQPCSRPLACGNHTCRAGCHDPSAMPCTPCALSCQVARGTCQHPCPLPCHPPGVACPPCDVRVTMPCHCSKTNLGFACAQVTAATLPSSTLCCGKTCHRELPGCPHTCQQACHEGECTSQGCCEEVTVRCACKRSKRKLPCGEVQRLLLAATGSAAYNGATALRLLPCEPACAKAEAAEAAGAAPAGSASANGGGGAKAGADSSGGAGATAAAAGAAAAAAAAAEEAPRRKLTKQEKEAEREAARQAKEAARLRKQRRQLLALAAFVLLAVLLALGLRHLLVVLDQKAQAAWRTEL